MLIAYPTPAASTTAQVGVKSVKFPLMYSIINPNNILPKIHIVSLHNPQNIPSFPAKCLVVFRQTTAHSFEPMLSNAHIYAINAQRYKKYPTYARKNTKSLFFSPTPYFLFAFFLLSPLSDYLVIS